MIFIYLYQLHFNFDKKQQKKPAQKEKNNSCCFNNYQITLMCQALSDSFRFMFCQSVCVWEGELERKRQRDRDRNRDRETEREREGGMHSRTWMSILGTNRYFMSLPLQFVLLTIRVSLGTIMRDASFNPALSLQRTALYGTASTINTNQVNRENQQTLRPNLQCLDSKSFIIRLCCSGSSSTQQHPLLVTDDRKTAPCSGMW